MARYRGILRAAVALVMLLPAASRADLPDMLVIDSGGARWKSGEGRKPSVTVDFGVIDALSADRRRSALRRQDRRARRYLTLSIPQPEPPALPGRYDPPAPPAAEARTETRPPAAGPEPELAVKRPEPAAAPAVEPEPELAAERREPAAAPAVEPEPELAVKHPEPAATPAAEQLAAARPDPATAPAAEPEPEPELAVKHPEPAAVPAVEPEPELAARHPEPAAAPAVEPEPELAVKHPEPVTAPAAEPEPELAVKHPEPAAAPAAEQLAAARPDPATARAAEPEPELAAKRPEPADAPAAESEPEPELAARHPEPPAKVAAALSKPPDKPSAPPAGVVPSPERRLPAGETEATPALRAFLNRTDGTRPQAAALSPATTLRAKLPPPPRPIQPRVAKPGAAAPPAAKPGAPGRFRLPPPAPATDAPRSAAASPAPAGGLPPPPPATGAGVLPPPTEPGAGTRETLRRELVLDAPVLAAIAAPVHSDMYSETFFYEAGGTALGAKDRTRLGGLAARLAGHTGLKVEIRAYSGSAEGDGLKARRGALSRALEIRGLLIAAGVPEGRIVARAAGAGEEARARVDVVMVGRS